MAVEKRWRQAAPDGGAKAMPHGNRAGIPGPKRGPVVMDFATAKNPGGWIYAAKSPGTLSPEGCVVVANRHLTRAPDVEKEVNTINGFLLNSRRLAVTKPR